MTSTPGRSSASVASAASVPLSSSSSPTRVSQWSVFLDQYDATSASIQRHFELLAPVRDLPTQQRLVDDVEQELFDGKHQVESIEQETQHFPYHLRSKAAAQLVLCKQQLERHYATLVVYQQRHKLGQVVTPQLLQRDQQAANATHNPQDERSTSNRALDDGIDDTTRLLSPSALSSSSASPSPTSSSLAASSSHMSNQRAALVSTAGHHYDFNHSADRTHSALLQSADIGQETATLLAQQRESLHRQHAALQHSDAMSAESSLSMDRTRCRHISDNLIAWLIVALQVGLFCIIARVKYFSS